MAVTEHINYMEKCVQKHRINYNREVLRGAPEEVLRNIKTKLEHYQAAVEALKKVEPDG